MPFEMSAVELEMHLRKVGLCLPILMQVPAAEMLENYEHWDAIGWVLDPSGYRDYLYAKEGEIGANIRHNKAMLKALVEFQKVLAAEYPQLAPS